METELKDRLKDLGFDKVNEDIKKAEEENAFKVELKKKMTVAYEMYRYVKPEQIEHFNEKLREKTQKEFKTYSTYMTLKFYNIKDYSDVPPNDVLDKLETAKSLNVFDTFEIAKIDTVKEVKDPLLFGIINGCKDKFFIAEWDNDVKISDLLKDNEG